MEQWFRRTLASGGYIRIRPDGRRERYGDNPVRIERYPPSITTDSQDCVARGWWVPCPNPLPLAVEEGL